MNAKPLTNHDLSTLVKTVPGKYASIFLACRNGAAVLQSRIYLKNAAGAIEDELNAHANRPTHARDFVAPLYALVEDDAFWKNQGAGLAIFLSSRSLQAFRLRCEPRNDWWFGDRNRVLPLLSRQEIDYAYHLLAVSANEATLYAGSAAHLELVPVKGLSQGLEKVLNFDQPTALIQVLNTANFATFHGQGATIDRHKDDLLAYFRLIDRALQPHLAESHAPLLFAGVGYLFPIYRQVNTYPHLLEPCLTGNPERMGKAELQDRAAELLKLYHHRSYEADIARYEDAVGSHRTSENLRSVLGEAHRGMIDTLFVAEGETVWGRFDVSEDVLTFANADDPLVCDLHDLAAYQTLAHGGRVHVAPASEVPHGQLIAALLRYPTSTTATSI